MKISTLSAVTKEYLVTESSSCSPSVMLLRICRVRGMKRFIDV